jgi:phospholipase D1/2
MSSTDPLPVSPTPNPYTRKAVLWVLAVGFVLGCIWRFTPLHQRFGLPTLIAAADALEGHPWTLPVMLAAFVLGGFLFFFHAILLWATVFAFNPVPAFFYCEAGSIASALAVYGLGRVLRRDVVRKIAGSYMGHVSDALGRKGVLSLVLLHFFPICPFSMLNLLAGATHISLRDFVIGTIIGITPGIILICFYGNRLVDLVKHPHLAGVLSFLGFVAIGLLVLTTARRRLLRKTGTRD